MPLVLLLRLTSLACCSRSSIARRWCAVEHACAIPTIKVRELLYQSVCPIVICVLHLSSRTGLICWLRRLQICLLLILVLWAVLSMLLLRLLGRKGIVHEVTAATHVVVIGIW